MRPTTFLAVLAAGAVVDVLAERADRAAGAPRLTINLDAALPAWLTTREAVERELGADFHRFVEALAPAPWWRRWLARFAGKRAL